MAKKNDMNFKELTKYVDEVQNFMYKCKCSHTVMIAKAKKYVICSHCGRRVYRNKEEEFKNRLEEKLYGRYGRDKA